MKSIIVTFIYLITTLSHVYAWTDLRITESEIDNRLERYFRRPNIIPAFQRAIHSGSIAQDILDLYDQSNPENRCSACRKSLIVVRKIATHARRQLPLIMQQLCASEQLKNNSVCSIDFYLPRENGDHSSFVNDLANVLTLMNPRSADAEYFCHYLAQGLCPMPKTPTETEKFRIYAPVPTPKKYMNNVGIRRSGETFKVLHLSDIHLSAEYLEGSEANCQGFMCCTKDSKMDPFDQRHIAASRFGHYKCDAPRTLIESSLTSINSVARKDKHDYEFAIFTGDMVDHNPMWISYNQSIQEEEDVMKYLKSYLGDVPVYCALGNHDTYPFSQIAQKASGFAKLFSFNSKLMAHLWKDYGWIDRRTAREVATNYGGYAVTTKRGLRIISLNSNFWYRWNFYNYWNMEDPDTSGMLEFLQNELLKSEKKGQRVWILAHVPPGGIADEAMPIASHYFTQIVQRFSPKTIAALFFGHTHMDEFTVVYAGNDEKSVQDALAVAFIGPSITPLSNYNPSWRYYEVDSESFEIMDAVTYYAKLNETFVTRNYNQTFGSNSLRWEFEYSARKEYDPDNKWPSTEPLTAHFWHEVAQQIKYNQTFAQIYTSNAYRRSPHVPKCISAHCRYENYCYTTSMSVTQALQCREKYNVTTRKFLTGAPTYPMPRPIRELLDANED